MRTRLILSRQTWSFVLGLCVVAVALVSPLHELSEQRLFAHMIQHELLMAIAPPLLVVGQPLVLVLLLLPRTWRIGVVRVARNRALRRAWRAVTLPFVAWLIHALAIWVWHIPVLFDNAVRIDSVHALQHLSFLGSGLLFWWTILHPARRAERGIAIIALFTTAVHTAVLGALMTFARAPWYTVYAGSTGALTPLADQQLAGMIMWIPASLVYLIAALSAIRRWLADSELGVSVAPSRASFAAAGRVKRRANVRREIDSSSVTLLRMTTGKDSPG